MVKAFYFPPDAGFLRMKETILYQGERIPEGGRNTNMATIKFLSALLVKMSAHTRSRVESVTGEISDPLFFEVFKVQDNQIEAGKPKDWKKNKRKKR